MMRWLAVTAVLLLVSTALLSAAELKRVYGSGEKCQACGLNADCAYVGPVNPGDFSNITFACMCQKGYEPNDAKSQCVDADECIKKLDNCDDNADCTNTKGSFYCKCKPGFNDTSKGDLRGVRCDDINECKEFPGICQIHACENTIGGYTCNCASGYEHLRTGSKLMLNVCTDIDECKLDASCPVNSYCNNTKGNYTCHCNTGFKKAADGSCENINECSLFFNPCDEARSTCRDTIGDYECACKSGFDRLVLANVTDNKHCTDINECLVNRGGCDRLADCENTDGSYKCQCIYGYTGDGHNGSCTVSGDSIEKLEEKIQNLTYTQVLLKLYAAYQDKHRLDLEMERVKRLCPLRDRLTPAPQQSQRVKREVTDIYQLSIKEHEWHLKAVLSHVSQLELQIDLLKERCGIKD